MANTNWHHSLRVREEAALVKTVGPATQRTEMSILSDLLIHFLRSPINHPTALMPAVASTCVLRGYKVTRLGLGVRRETNGSDYKNLRVDEARPCAQVGCRLAVDERAESEGWAPQF